MAKPPKPAEPIGYFAADQLFLSDLNPRQIVTDAEIKVLALSLMSIGQLQSLAGIAHPDGRCEIVAGGRRMRALQLIAAHPSFSKAPGRANIAAVPVMLTDDREVGRAWALAENVGRSGLHPAQEVRAYADMQKAGNAPHHIAIAFAVTEDHVRRRLKLATLPDAALDALAADKISLGQAAAITSATDPERIPDLVEMAIRGSNEYSLRRAATEGWISATERRAAFVGLEAYETAGGRVSRDLFSDSVVLEDEKLLDELFNDAVAARIEAIKAEGWAWVEFADKPWVNWWDIKLRKLAQAAAILTEEDEAELLALEEADQTNGGLDDDEQARWDALEAKQAAKGYTAADMAVSGVIFCIDNRGVVEQRGGYVRAEDLPRAFEAGLVSSSSDSGADAGATPAPADPLALPAAVIEDLRAVRLATVQSALLFDTDLALDFLAFALLNTRSSLGITVQRGKVAPSNADGFDFPENLTMHQVTYDTTDHVEKFEAFRAQRVEDRRAALAGALIPALGYNCTTDFIGGVGRAPAALFDHIEALTVARTRANWRPTASNFFGRAKSAYLDVVFAELTGEEPGSDTLKSFAALKKGLKAEILGALIADGTHRTFEPAGIFRNIKTDGIRARADVWMPSFDGGARA